MIREEIKTITDIVHKTIYTFFDVCGDDEEVPVSDKDKLLLEVNKAICNNLKALKTEPCEDCVSRQRVLDIVEFNRNSYDGNDAVVWIEREIKELPSVQPEPFINKPCVSEQTCHEDKMKVLEKIKAEIEQRRYGIANDSVIQGMIYEREDILEIIDKHMKESEEEECK